MRTSITNLKAKWDEPRKIPTTIGVPISTDHCAGMRQMRSPLPLQQRRRPMRKRDRRRHNRQLLSLPLYCTALVVRPCEFHHDLV